MSVRFSPWLPLAQANAAAPAHPGLWQVRGEGLRVFPLGKSAMVHYGASAQGESLARHLAQGGRADLEAAAARGGCFVRFAPSDRPQADLERLVRRFVERFGAPPSAELPTATTTPISESDMNHDDDEKTATEAERPSGGFTYRDAGVDIDAGESLVERIKPHVRRTLRPEVLGGLGGFAGLCALPRGYRDPVLVACTDGVGTKLKLAFSTGKHDTVGIDLVAMNVNDMVVSGAEPLLFLDYFAASRLKVEVATQVIAGIAEGCRQAGCALLGGETAELPGFYQGEEYDLAGFAVGVVEREGRVDGRTIAPGDVLLGLASSGFHSNGYSLVRKVLLEHAKLDLASRPAGLEEPLGEALLRPTRIYVKAMRALYAEGWLKGAAHVTGGGLVENPTRMLPEGARLKLWLDVGTWRWPPLFEIVARTGNVSVAEMRRTFNLGLGMLVCVAPENVATATTLLEGAGETVFRVGGIDAAEAPLAPVEFRG